MTHDIAPTHRRLVVIGDSHVLMLKQAQQKHPELLADYDSSIMQLSKVKAGKIHGEIRVDDAALLATELKPSDLLVSVVGGSLFHQVSLVEHTTPFSLHTADGQIGTGQHNIPRACFKAVLRDLMERNELPKLRQMSETKTCLRLHVCAPPPRCSTDIDMIALSRKFPAVQTQGLGDDALRLEAWNIQREIQREICAELDIGFIDVPKQATTQAGFLRPKLFSKDTTHANVGYGIYVLKQISDLASTLSSSSVHKGASHVSSL